MSDVRKRSVTLSGHRTSYSIEDRFQDILTEMAAEQSIPLAALIARIDSERGNRSNLSSALRLAILDYLLEKRSRQMPVKAFNSG